MEYFQQLRDKMLKEKAALLEGAEGSQVAGSKCKEVAARDKEGQQPFKKARGKQPEKYYRDATVMMGDSNPCASHSTITLAMIPTYSGVLSAIKKALQELVEEYRGVGKSLWDLVEGQERNTA